MLAALEAVNPLWTQYFDEANAMHDLDKDLEAARMADYAMRFGLDPDQVPELEAEVNTVSMEVARDLLRDQAQRLFKTAGQLPDHQSVSQQAVRTEPDTDMRHSLKNLPDRSQVWYHKDKKIKGEIITPQVEVHLSRSTNGAFILDKEVSRLADGANGLGMRLQAVIDDDGIRARVQNAHLAGQTHFDHQLSPAESIQAAEAMMAHLQGEAAPWESPES
jgi:hypothetical protein